MEAGLRTRLGELLQFGVPPAPELVVLAAWQRDEYVEQTVGFAGDEGEVPALLLLPESPCGSGVVVHHQHHGQWHFGKSEVAGLCGDRWQAFGPALARRGVSVLTHDAVGFEDKYSLDASRIADAAAGAYRDTGAPDALQHFRAHGGHALTEERFNAIIDWVSAKPRPR